MNLIEHLFIQAAGELCEKTERGTPEESKLANEEALAVLQKIDPAKLQGLVVMGIQSCEPDETGNKGFELISTMIGSPELIIHLASGARVFTQLHQLKEHSDELVKAGLSEHSLLIDAVLGESSVQGGKVAGRYDVPEGVTKQ